MSGRQARRGLVLVGYRGTGKTTVGRLLADRLDWRFADTDHEIEARSGRSIVRIFAELGEPAFRDVEQEVVADLAQLPETVVATGGGAILRPANRAAMRSVGFVAWLTADPETLCRRLRRDETRPALTPAGALGEIADVLAERARLYREVSDLEVDTAGRSGHEVAQSILRDWQWDGGR